MKTRESSDRYNMQNGKYTILSHSIQLKTILSHIFNDYSKILILNKS